MQSFSGKGCVCVRVCGNVRQMVCRSVQPVSHPRFGSQQLFGVSLNSVIVAVPLTVYGFGRAVVAGTAHHIQLRDRIDQNSCGYLEPSALLLKMAAAEAAAAAAAVAADEAAAAVS